MVSKEQKNSKATKKTTSKKQNKEIVPTPTPTIPVAPVETNKNVSLFTEVDKKKIKEAILLAQIEFAKLKNTVKCEQKRDIDTLEHQIKEFMGPFMLIGYDLNNNPIEMVSAYSVAEHDALLERFRRVMYKINQNIANSNGEDPYGHQNIE
jgi:hypothetical protein